MRAHWQFYLTSTVFLKAQLSVFSVKACIIFSTLAKGTCLAPMVNEFAIPALMHVNKKNKNKWTAALLACPFLEEVWLWPGVVPGTRCCNPLSEDTYKCRHKMEIFSTGAALTFMEHSENLWVYFWLTQWLGQHYQPLVGWDQGSSISHKVGKVLHNKELSLFLHNFQMTFKMKTWSEPRT